MKLFEIDDCSQVLSGLPVKQGDGEGPYILVGQWLQQSNGERSWWHLFGHKIALEAGLPLVIGSDGTSRVTEGSIVYRNNALLLRACDKSDDSSVVGVLVRYNAPRLTLATRPYSVAVVRSILTENADVYQTYQNGPLAISFAALRTGSTLTIRETRTLRRAGTGVSWSRPFNFAQHATVTNDVHVIRMDDVSREGLATSLSRDSTVERVLVEGWVGKKTALITVERNIEPGALLRQMASALGLGEKVNAAAPGFKFDEVAPAA